MSSLTLLLLLLCLSLHACISRPLALTQKQTAKCLFHKDFDKLKILEEQQKVGHDETIICEISGSASTLKEVVIGPSNRYAGAKITTSFETDSPPTLQAEGQRRHTRSMLGPAQHHVEETVNPKQSETMENMVEMDYAQPHRKPPIHNEKP